MPWASWQEVQETREALRASRFLLLRRQEHLTADEQERLAGVLASPVGARLRVARAFLEEWYGLWRDERGERREWGEAWMRYQAWRTNAAYQALAPLRKVTALVDEPRFRQLSHFLRRPEWEATNNAVERTGRAFRHQQGPHYNLRASKSIEAALKARAQAHKAVSTGTVSPTARSRRGRKTKVKLETLAA